MVTGVLSRLGLLLVIAGKLSLGRSFGLMPANRGIVSTGLYRLVRHPIYLGYLITHVAFVPRTPTPWNLLAAARRPRADGARGLRGAHAGARPKYRAYQQIVRWRVCRDCSEHQASGSGGPSLQPDDRRAEMAVRRIAERLDERVALERRPAPFPSAHRARGRGSAAPPADPPAPPPVRTPPPPRRHPGAGRSAGRSPPRLAPCAANRRPIHHFPSGRHRGQLLVRTVGGCFRVF